MPTDSQRLDHAVRVVRLVSEDLRRLLLGSGSLWDFEIVDLSDRLDLALELIQPATE